MLAWLLPAAASAWLLAAPAAPASFHVVQVREVYPGTIANPESEYVELQMWSGGQNLVEGHFIRVLDASGVVKESAAFSGDVANGANQSTLLLATAKAQAEFGVTADVLLGSEAISPTGGAVCWESVDCVSWGSFSKPSSLPSPAGTPAIATGIPDGTALQRTISRGCATALDSADDSDDSAADFSLVTPQPRPNSVAPGEQLCSSGGGGATGGGSSGGAGQGAPQTTLKRKPPKRSTDRTPTFRFGAEEPGARFECKLDGGRFRTCRSPYTTKALAIGPHAFRVRAVDSGGRVDPSPAVYRFKILRPGG